MTDIQEKTQPAACERPIDRVARDAGIPTQAGAPATLKLNLGCGPVQPPDWVNIDGSNRARFASRFWPLDRLLVAAGVLPETEFGPQVTIHDLRKPLPFAESSVACVYAGELWEHFELPDSERLTRDCFRVLAPGGVLRLCVPDGVAFWRDYIALHSDQMNLPSKDRDATKIRNHVQLYFHDIATRRILLGSLGHTHKWQFDEVQLIEMLQQAGFADVARMPFHSSRIADVGGVERSDFLIVEGVKPHS